MEYNLFRDEIDDPSLSIQYKTKAHFDWIHWVLTQGLEWHTGGIGEDLKISDAIPENIRLERAEYDLVLRPDYAMYGGNNLSSPTSS